MAAKVKTNATKAFIKKPKKKRPGVYSKCRYSKLKSSKLYKKLNRGQG